jgi:hypothetical protein
MIQIKGDFPPSGDKQPMSKVIPFDQLARAQHLNFLEHKRREYQEREDYLARLRRLLFQIEGQMRQAEVLQMELFLQSAKHFQVNLEMPIQGDRLAVQRAFTENPFLASLTEFLAGRLTPQECFEKIDLLKEKPPKK